MRAEGEREKQRNGAATITAEVTRGDNTLVFCALLCVCVRVYVCV